MEYRIIYNDTEVVSYAEHNETSITKTLQKYFVGNIDSAITNFRQLGINYDILIDDFNIEEKELFNVNISDISSTSGDFNRRISVIALDIDYSSEIVYTTVKIITESEDEIEENGIKRHTFKMDNTLLVDDGEGGNIGEFDYFYKLVMDDLIPLPTIISNKFTEMDSRNIFDSL